MEWKSVGMMKFHEIPNWMEQWKMFQTTNQIYIYSSHIFGGSEFPVLIDPQLSLPLSLPSQAQGWDFPPSFPFGTAVRRRLGWTFPKNDPQSDGFCAEPSTLGGNSLLVGGFSPPPWKMMEFVSWDDEIPNWMESHLNFHGSSHHQYHQSVAIILKRPNQPESRVGPRGDSWMTMTYWNSWVDDSGISHLKKPPGYIGFVNGSII